MRIRTQLALTFLALTILPLGGLVGYSYYSSSGAVRAALEEEAAELAEEMDEKLAATRLWVARTVRNVDPIAIESLGGEREDGGSRAARKVISEMGSAATLVRSLEFVPSQFVQERMPTDDIPRSRSGIAVMVGPAPPVPPVPAPPDGAASPAPPAPPPIRQMEIDIQEALREVRAEREKLGESHHSDQSMEIALRVIEAIPLETILDQSLKSVELGLAAAGSEIEAEVARKREESALRRSQISELREMAVRGAAEQSHTARKTEAGATATDEPTAPSIPVVQDGEVVGSMRADVHDEEILRNIFLTTAAQGDEIPFAIDSTGNLYSRSAEHEQLINELNVPSLVAATPEASRFVQEDWIIATSKDPSSGMIIGVVRPAAEAIAEVRKATFRSLGLGLALVGICLIGVLPLANHMTRDIAAVTEGAERISRGELDAAVDVKSRNEVGRLATVFNRMSSELRSNQKKLVEEEAARREQEIREQLLKSEYDRTASELEDARQFQLSMLPSSLPNLKHIDIAVEMTTATEVGGDYYDFHVDDRGLTIALGDGTGHGAKAGTMVAVIKSLFTALRTRELKDFLQEASAAIRSMQLGRMSMALALLRIEKGILRFAAAGMPPVLVCPADGGAIRELETPGVPLGTIAFPYEERTIDLRPGDLIVAMSDGLPELPDADGEPFGYERVLSLVRGAREESPSELIASIQTAAEEWRGERPQNDDMTLLVLKYRG